MAVFAEIRPECLESHNECVNSRPDCVKRMIEKCPVNRLYRMKSTGKRVTIYSYAENETVTVDITGEYNLIDFPRRVFGVDINDLEECDLPGEDELLGTTLNEEETLAKINALRFLNGLPAMSELQRDES